MNKKLIILDRDGVINFDSKDYIKSPEEFIPIPGSLDAIASLNKAGFTVVVATNQAGIGRGLFCGQTLSSIHNKLHELLEQIGGKIENIFYCPHHPDENCLCRKPKPGLLLKIQAYYQIPLDSVPFIGDSFRDIAAAREAGCTPILVKTGNGEKTLKEHKHKLADTKIFESLGDAASYLLAGN